MSGLMIPVPARAQGATADQYYAAGVQMYNSRNYTQALQYLNAAIKLNPNNAAAYQAAGNCYYAMGNKPYALTYYQRASALQPTNAQLAQFVRNLQAQAGGAPAAAAPNYLSQGYSLFQQRQYAAALPYFQRAIQQNPNDYRPYYYAGYAYYMTGNAKYAALYFEVANAKQPNASVKAYADRVKAGLGPEDQQWVDDQASKYTGTAVAGGAAASTGGKGGGSAFGFHLMGGMEYVLADPSQITKYVQGSYNGANAVSLSGVTPNLIGLPELEPFVQLGPNFEVNLAIGYFPVGNLSYTTYDYYHSYNGGIPIGTPDVWKYVFNTTIVTADLGVKLLFGGNGVKGYLGLGGGVSPVSLALTKTQYDSTGTTPIQQDAVSNGSYNTMAINGQALLGVDFSLGKGIAFGPYVGYRYLSATNFQKGGNTLVVDNKTGAVGLPGSPNVPNGDPTTALTLDFSGIESGLNFTFSF